MLLPAFLHSLVASAFLARSSHASPTLQPRDNNGVDWNPTDKIFPHYTALGDSYASGVGAFNRLDGDPSATCRRSTESYPYQFLTTFGDAARISSFSFPACTGADTAGASAQIGADGAVVTDEPLPRIGYDFGHPDLVSISVGGNTGRMFGTTIEKCVLALFDYAWDSADYAHPCEVAWYNDYVTLYGLGDSLPTLFEKARTTNLKLGQEREVYVLGYARFYTTDKGHEHCPKDHVLPTPTLDGIALEINAIVGTLNGVLRKAAQEAGVMFVDVDEVFEGHRICDRHCWFQTRYEDGEDIFHPTKDGYQAMMLAFEKAVLGSPVGGALVD